MENLFGYRTENIEGPELVEYYEEVNNWISDKDHFKVAEIPLQIGWNAKIC